ncbi:MAG: DUF4349 domain-containing protein [Lachnospiraceae bacterium]|nr:DUF4349 domain-containing protein [Lachnospiraceae bacterium]
MKKKVQLFYLLLMMVLSLIACGGSASSDTYVMETTAAAAFVETAADTRAVMYKEEAVEEEFESGDVLTGNSEVSVPQNTGRKLIRTVNLYVETDDFDNLLTKLQEQIAALSGYIEQSDVSGKSMQSDYSRRHAFMTVRVPSTSLDQFVSSVESSGNVTNKSETTTDVTLKYSDLESKKKSLTIEQERIFELLEKADTLESIIALEERLSEIRYELESMESRLRLYDNQVEYSTIHIDIEEVKVYTPMEPESIGQRIEKGLSRNIENMKESSVDMFVWIVSSSPIWIPVLAIALVVLLIIRKKAARKKVNQIMSGVNVSLDQEKKFEGSDSSTDTDRKY